MLNNYQELSTTFIQNRVNTNFGRHLGGRHRKGGGRATGGRMFAQTRNSQLSQSFSKISGYALWGRGADTFYGNVYCHLAIYAAFVVTITQTIRFCQ